jgi:siderophore synthetase component
VEGGHVSQAEGGLWHLVLEFSHTQVEVVAVVRDVGSLVQPWEYVGPAYFRTPRTGWNRLSGMKLAELVEAELSHRHEAREDTDFMVQIRDSLRVAQLIFERVRPPAAMPGSLVESEQSLVFGHPFHPSPKSRLGFTDQEVVQYSPEFRAAFQLHYFAVRREFVVQDSLEDGTCEGLIRAQSPSVAPALPTEFVLVPAHPWQARNLLELPAMARAIRNQEVLDLGTQGPRYFPLSSARTVLCPDQPYLYKLSLNVRITNCYRNNAPVDLRYALAAARRIRALRQPLWDRYPDFVVLEEPAILWVELPTGSPDQDRIIREGMGLALRQAVPAGGMPGERMVLAAAVFGNRQIGRDWLRQVVSGVQETEAWLTSYLRKLLPPLLDAFLRHGLMFEPHLQNVYLELQDGRPHRIFLRDLENVRIVAGYPGAEDPGQILDLPRAWDRFVYCLLVNHLAEAIGQLAYHDPGLNRRLWDCVMETLLHYADRSGAGAIRRQIEALITCPTLPAKCNLLGRFQRRPDRQAEFVPVTNPMTVARTARHAP